MGIKKIAHEKYAVPSQWNCSRDDAKNSRLQTGGIDGMKSGGLHLGFFWKHKEQHLDLSQEFFDDLKKCIIIIIFCRSLRAFNVSLIWTQILVNWKKENYTVCLF